MGRCKIKDRIGLLRTEQGLSQQELSDKFKEKFGKTVSREKIKNWENGEREIKTEDIILLSDFFGVSADYLLGLSEYRSIEGSQKEAAAYTGLSEKAVAVLHKLSKMPYTHGLISSMYPNYKSVASDMITSPSFAGFLESLNTINSIIADSIIHDQLDEYTWDEDGYIDKDGIREIKYSIFDCTETLQDVIDEMCHTRAIIKGATNEQGKQG